MLSLQKVHKSFGPFSAVKGVDLEIGEGLIFGLLGPNGAGKTTLLRMIMGLIMPTSGKITLFNSYSPSNKNARRKIGYMPQQLAVYPGLSAWENVMFFGRLYGFQGPDLKQKAEEVLQLVDLQDKRDEQVAHLSGGMVRRVMLATTLIHQPSLVILDEPTAGIDPSLRLRFWNWFQELTKMGISILITTHHISEAALCREVVFLRDGSLIEQGSPAELMGRYQAKDLEEAFVKATD